MKSIFYTFAASMAKDRQILAVITTGGLLQRSILLLRLHPALAALSSTRPQWLTWQYYPINTYRDHFWSGLWLLQQTPPIPHLLFKIALEAASWPVGVDTLLCALQAVISIATTCFLFIIIRIAAESRIVALVLSVWFLFSTDLAVMEYGSLGQNFYEDLGMLAVTACSWSLLRLRAPDNGASICHGALAGCFAALGALSRASLSYYAAVPALFIPRQSRALMAFLVPVALLQGGWSVKNSVLYGDFAWETSSWAGFNAANGIFANGEFPLLKHDIDLAPSNTYPDWFLRVNRNLVQPFGPLDEDDLPSAIRARDEENGQRLETRGVPENSLGWRVTSAQYKRAVGRFVFDHGNLFIGRFSRSYHFFWQRIADYGGSYIDPIYVERVDRELFDFGSRGFHEKQRVMVRHGSEAGGSWLVPPAGRPAHLLTLSLAPLDAASIFTVHLLLPALVFIDLAQRMRRKAPVLTRAVWLLAANAAYGLAVFNVADLGENMRFRLTVEPVLIALTAACLAIAVRGAWTLARGLWRARNAHEEMARLLIK